jgi:hypothetical protein
MLAWNAVREQFRQQASRVSRTAPQAVISQGAPLFGDSGVLIDQEFWQSRASRIVTIAYHSANLYLFMRKVGKPLGKHVLRRKIKQVL